MDTKGCSICKLLWSQPTRSRFCKGSKCKLDEAWSKLTEQVKEELQEVLLEDKANVRTKWNWKKLLEEAERRWKESQPAGLFIETDASYSLREVVPAAGVSAQPAAVRRRTRQRMVMQVGDDAVGRLHVSNGQLVWEKTCKVQGNAAKLRREFDALKCLLGLGIAPSPLTLCDEQPQPAALIMEYISHITLHMVHEKVKDIPEACLCAIHNSVMCGVRTMHAAKVIHGDIHGCNIMIRPHVWAVVFVDFMDSKQYSEEEAAKDFGRAREQVAPVCDDCSTVEAAVAKTALTQAAYAIIAGQQCDTPSQVFP
jgi:tRNA A-37 threonylcarbamoyl transferase component Bud32